MENGLKGGEAEEGPALTGAVLASGGSRSSPCGPGQGCCGEGPGGGQGLEAAGSQALMASRG